MAGRKYSKFVVDSDSEPEPPPKGSTQAMALTNKVGKGAEAPVDAARDRAVKAKQSKIEDEGEQEYSSKSAKTRATPKGKSSRMVKELGDLNEQANRLSECGSPEVLLEGLHRTRATRQNLNNAVNNKAPAVRKSLNNAALMEEAMSAKDVKMAGLKKKKSAKHQEEEDEIDLALRELDAKDKNARLKAQQKKKAPQTEETDEGMEEALNALTVQAEAPNKKKKKKAPKSETPTDEDFDDEDEDFQPSDTPQYLQPQSKQGKRRSSRIDSAAPTSTASGKVIAPSTSTTPLETMTPMMTWEQKKDVIAWILRKVDYGPYRPQVTRFDLEDVNLSMWFNKDYGGFNWDTSDITIAHFSPTASIFQDFENFLHTVEFFSGQQIGAVKVTIPEGFVQPQDPATSVTSQDEMVRAYKTTISLHAISECGTGAIHNITPDGPHHVSSQVFVKAIEADRRYLALAWSSNGAEPGGDIWKEYELVNVRSEKMTLASNCRSPRMGRLFVENACATKALRKELGCGDPGFIDFGGNSLQKSSSTKVGINTPAFDLTNAAGTAWGMQMTEIGAYKLVYHHSGAPRVWTVVKPSEFQKLEDLVAQTLHLPDPDNPVEDVLSNYEPRCNQFVGHKELSKSSEGIGNDLIENPGRTLYFTTETLKAEGIEFTKFVQYQGEMAIFFPFSYYQGYNVGPNIVETIAYGSCRWEIFPVSNLLRQCNRGCFQGKQPLLVDLSFAKPVLHAADGSRLSTEEAIERTRSLFLP